MQQGPPIDWRDLALLLSLQRAGSFAGAGKRLALDATTVGRRLRALEAAVGAPLIDRRDRRVELTEAGEALVSVAELTERGLTEVRRQVALDHEAPMGVVRLTTMEVLASRFVAPALPRLLKAHPGLLLEIDTSPRIRDLSRGEADLALRLSRPEEPSVVRRSIGSVSLSAYVAPSLARDPKRLSPRGLRSMPQVLFGLRFAVQEGDWLRTQLPDAPVVLRTDSVSTALSAVRAGAGLGLLPDLLAEGLVRVELGAQAPARGVWLAMHPTSARQPRVRAVAKFLAETFAR